MLEIRSSGRVSLPEGSLAFIFLFRKVTTGGVWSRVSCEACGGMVVGWEELSELYLKCCRMG